MDRNDIDSNPLNQNANEDDMAKACVSVPLNICPARSETVLIKAKPGYQNYQWYHNGVLIIGATSDSYLATAGGEYIVQITDIEGCAGEGCCPIYIAERCDCPPNPCDAFIISN